MNSYLKIFETKGLTDRLAARNIFWITLVLVVTFIALSLVSLANQQWEIAALELAVLPILIFSLEVLRRGRANWAGLITSSRLLAAAVLGVLGFPFDDHIADQFRVTALFSLLLILGALLGRSWRFTVVLLVFGLGLMVVQVLRTDYPDNRIPSDHFSVPILFALTMGLGGMLLKQGNQVIQILNVNGAQLALRSDQVNKLFQESQTSLFLGNDLSESASELAHHFRKIDQEIGRVEGQIGSVVEFARVSENLSDQLGTLEAELKGAMAQQNERLCSREWLMHC